MAANPKEFDITVVQIYGQRWNVIKIMRDQGFIIDGRRNNVVAYGENRGGKSTPRL